MLKIFIYKINNKKISDNKLQFLSLQEKKRAKAFRNIRDCNLYIAGKHLTRKVIAQQFKIKARDIVFKSDKFSRPSLVYPKVKNFDFNLSHSGNIVVLVIANDKVGIDIEQIRPIDLEIAKNYFHEEEIKFVHSQKNNELENFYQIWALKESFIKAMGRGLSYPLKIFYFEFKGGKIKLHSRFKKQNWHFKIFNNLPGYKLAICVENFITKEKLRIIRVNNIL